MKNIKIDLPDSFFEEEVRDGYTVSKQMKKVWAVEMDLCAELDRVCRKYGLPYYAEGGTVLGAARHKGFIPWDDDIDIAMFRNDYERLCEIGPKEFKDPYFFQTEITDPGSLRGHAQLRNSRTTAIRRGENTEGCRFNQGIFIDIFILDNLPDDPKEREEVIEKVYDWGQKSMSYGRLTTRYEKHTGLKGAAKAILHTVLGKKVNPYFRAYDRLAAKYRNEKTEECALLTFGPKNKSFRYRNEWYEKTAYLPFETMELPVPYMYREYLTRHYGDWETPQKANTYHGDLIFDPDLPYTEYKNS